MPEHGVLRVQENRVATLQSLSGTGSLRVGADFIAKFLPGTTAYLSNPTWGNHKVLTLTAQPHQLQSAAKAGVRGFRRIRCVQQ